MVHYTGVVGVSFSGKFGWPPKPQSRHKGPHLGDVIRWGVFFEDNMNYMPFHVLSRWDAENLPPYPKSHAFISITDPGSKDADIKPSDECKGILRLKFHDTDREDVSEWFLGVKLVPINAEQVQQIVDFFKEMRDKVDVFFVHCEAGISRSAGCAAALSLIQNEDDVPYFHGPYNPNRLVYRKVLENYHNYKRPE